VVSGDKSRSEWLEKRYIVANMTSKAWKQQQPARYDTMTAYFVDDPRSVSSSKDPLVVDILNGDDATTASTTSSHNDTVSTTDSAAATAAIDWQYVRDEIQ
jgi:hypothetical protein